MKAATATKARPSTEIPRDLAVQQASVMKGRMPAQLISQKQYEDASGYLRRLVNFGAQWKAYWADVIDPLKEAYDAARGKRDDVEKPRAVRERDVRNLLSEWVIRKETEQAQLDAKNAAAAEEDAKKKHDAEIEAAKKLGAPAEIVEAMRQQPLAVSEPTPSRAYQKYESQSSYDEWSAVCLDKQALIVHCAAHPEDANLLKEDQTKLNARADSQHELFNVPGCEVRKKKIIRQSKF